MLHCILLLTLFAAADSPLIEPEVLQQDVRRLEAEMRAVPRHMPAGYLVGTMASFTVGAGLGAFNLFLAAISIDSRGGVSAITPTTFVFIGIWVLAGVSILTGFALLLEGLNASEGAAMLRKELGRKRDALLRQLRQPTPDAAFDAVTTF